MNVVALIVRRFRTDVCSAHLPEPDRANERGDTWGDRSPTGC